MAMNLEAARWLIYTSAWAKDHPEAFADGSAQWQSYELMALAFGGTGVVSGMPIEKYVRDALITGAASHST